VLITKNKACDLEDHSDTKGGMWTLSDMHGGLKATA